MNNGNSLRTKSVPSTESETQTAIWERQSRNSDWDLFEQPHCSQIRLRYRIADGHCRPCRRNSIDDWQATRSHTGPTSRTGHYPAGPCGFPLDRKRHDSPHQQWHPQRDARARCPSGAAVTVPHLLTAATTPMPPRSTTLATRRRRSPVGMTFHWVASLKPGCPDIRFGLGRAET
jgi:hypothetical protein